jgi:hypothetical protein
MFSDSSVAAGVTAATIEIGSPGHGVAFETGIDNKDQNWSNQFLARR